MRGFFIVYLLLTCFLLSAQYNSPPRIMHPDKRLQIGWYATNSLIHGDIEFDLSYRFHGRHSLGISLGYYRDNNDHFCQHQDTMDYGKGIRVFHKIFLYRSWEDHLLYVRYGARLRHARYKYLITDYYEFQEGGSTFLRKETKTFWDNAVQFNGEIVFGGEVVYAFFYFDYYIGYGVFGSKFKEEYLPSDPDLIPNDTRYEGGGFIAGVRLGIYLPVDFGPLLD